ncbi:MAG: DUF4065 domain-containing protein [Nitrosopumilaceae archaeon]|nr:DUF4065 domain-containing protein [Nitrosopumilaceae archaeon]
MMGVWRGHSSLLVSDYIVSRHSCRFTPFQLIKMTVISHGRTLAALGRPLIRDRIEAWKHGPVIPVLYHELKIWGSERVYALHYCGTILDENESRASERRVFFDSVLPADERSIIDGVVEEYGNWSFGDLRRLCHEPGSPWDTHYDGKLGTEIPDPTIQAYYTREMIP